MATPNKDKLTGFDQVKLQNMHEPLTIRCEKIRGNVRQPIELPPKGNEQTGFHPPGTNWTRDEVLQLENFILTKWSGGGYYDFTVTDAKGERMTWQGVWDPRVYPEKVPPNTVEAAMVNQPTQQPVNAPQQMQNSIPAFGVASQYPQIGFAGYPSVVGPPHTGPIMPAQPPTVPTTATATPQQTVQYVPPPAPQAQAQPAYPPWYGYAPPPLYPYGQAPSPFTTGPFSTNLPQFGRRFGGDDESPLRKRQLERDDEERKELESKLRQAEMDRKELEYKQSLERQQQVHEQQIAALRDEMRRLGDARGKGEDEEVKRMREEAQRQREQAQTERAAFERQIMEQQLLQMRQAHEASLVALREQLARLAETPKGDDNETRRLRDDFERQRQDQERRLEAERHERERERERYERERRDELLQREMKEQREATERRIEQLMASQRGSDPMIDAMKENARMNAEQMREIARMQTDSTNRMAQFMVAPAQLAQIMKDNSNGTDGVVRSIIGSVGEIGNLYKNAAETIMQMSGGGSDPPAARLIQEGIGRATEVAERYLAVKRDQVISEGKVKQAEVARDQTKIQADAHLRAAAMQAQAAAARGWSPPPPVVDATSNGAAHVNTNATANVNVPQGQGAGLAGAAVADSTKAKNPSDEEMFGMALESVKRLRAGVASGTLAPDKAIDAVLQGVNYVVTNKLEIPVFTLFTEERWADFVDVMLPDAPQEYRQECVRILIEEVEQHTDPPADTDVDISNGVAADAAG